MNKNKTKILEQTDFEAGQIDALGRVLSSLQKWEAEILNTTFGQLNVLSNNDDLAFAKLKERISTIRNIASQINEIRENI